MGLLAVLSRAGFLISHLTWGMGDRKGSCVASPSGASGVLVSRASVWEEGKLPVVTVPLAGVRWTPWTVICRLCP